MAETSKLCLGCMCEKTGDGPCEQCGYTEGTAYLPSYLAPGTVLNERYLTGKLLSYNGEGATYIGYDKVTNQKVTIKEYMPDTLCSRTKGDPMIKVDPNQSPLYKTYMSEFIELNKSLLKSRTMTHIQTVLDIFPENNTAYVIFEYINGISLKSFLQNCSGELTWERVKELFPPILTTLSLVHSAGILHRGISPQTILVTEKNELKLIDFEISAGRITGTEIACEMYPGFSAPEQYSTSEWNGTWTDVYGISAVLYRVLTGCTPTEAIARVGTDNCPEPMAINRNVPSHVSKVIMNGLKLNTSARIQTITELVVKLFEQPKFNTAETDAVKPAPVTRVVRKVDSKTAEEIKRSNAAAAEAKKKAATRNAVIIGIAICAVIIIGFSIAIGILSSGGNTSQTSDPNFYQPPEQTTTSTTVTSKPVESSAPTSSNIVDETIYMCPDFTNRVFASIQENASYSFLKITPKYKFDDKVASGLVISQNVKADTEVTYGTEIEIVVSKGPQEVELPEYADMKVDDYLAILSQKNIKFEKKPMPTKDVKEGYVVKCSKEVGEMVNVEKSEMVTVFFAVKSIAAVSSYYDQSSAPAETEAE